ncbi:Lsr2 family protein [Streptomyces sp. H10-C2]|uniref:histone-like nucleoid-structuring protein Lsr2 n=1 Tax=unclassified Streptomyces TaxID=2593676 RepID=UPI0024B94F9E|nr:MULTISPECIES: Lsr2 family protein [unclassified Streptomyces]MDJ0347448.1 Lsr2 family protein [Streptomyces sp. PH10-H1]MDJ0375670.1 Lsr2 family protein [Streptomyces sp. H10-C2]
MAQKIVTIYTDDLTGEESSEATTHTLAIDGIVYELDLSPESFDKLLDATRPFTEKGRRAGRGKSSVIPRKASRPGDETARIRAWAKENGYDVNDRGRVPATVREAYENAH